MNPLQVDLRFKDEAQKQEFAAATVYYQRNYGYLPTDEVIINMVIESANDRKERDESRANYNMLMQKYTDITHRYRQILDRLEELQNRFSSEAKRA